MKKNEIFKITKKMLKSTVSIILSIVLTATGINVGTVSHAVSANQEISSIAKNEDEKVSKKLKETKESKEKNKKATVVRELKELRTSNSTTYLLSNGSRKLEVCGKDIRYKENGKYVDYDPTLRAITKSEQKELKEISKNKSSIGENIAADYAYVNTAGDAKQYFPKKIDEDSGVILTKKDYTILFVPVIKDNDEKKNLENNENIGLNNEYRTSIDDSAPSLRIEAKSVREDNVTYSGDKGNVSYKYTSLTNGVKEEIILEEKPDVNIFKFKLNLQGMKMEMFDDSKEIRITDKKTNKLVAYVNEPNIKDSDDELTYKEIRYEIEEGKDGEYILKVVVDKDYLDSEDTKYPVTIDPTVWWVNDRLESAGVSSFQYEQDTNKKNTNTIRVQNKGLNYAPYTISEEVCYIDTSGIDTNNTFIGSTETFYGSNVEEAYLSITEKDNVYTTGPNTSKTFTSGNIEVRTPSST